MSGSADRPLKRVAFLPKPIETVELEQRVQKLVELAMCRNARPHEDALGAWRSKKRRSTGV